MDITTVKEILQINTTKHDPYLGIVLPFMIEAVKDYCNNNFLDEEGQEDLPGGVKIAIAKWCEYNMLRAGVSGQSQGVSYSYDTEVPDSIKSLLKPHRKVRF